MSREYANKFNSILMQRTKNRVEDFHKPTDITKLLERNQEPKQTRQGFDKYFRGHAKEAEKTRNIRGLFKIPANDNHLVVDAHPEDKKEEESEEEEKVEPEHMEEEKKEERQEDRPKTKIKEIVQVEGFEDPIYRYDDEDAQGNKKQMTINDYINLAKRKPGRDIGLMNPNTMNPQFVVNYDGQKVRLHLDSGMKPWVKFPSLDTYNTTRRVFGDVPTGIFDQ